MFVTVKRQHKIPKGKHYMYPDKLTNDIKRKKVEKEEPWGMFFLLLSQTSGFVVACPTQPHFMLDTSSLPGIPLLLARTAGSCYAAAFLVSTSVSNLASPSATRAM